MELTDEKKRPEFLERTGHSTVKGEPTRIDR
jgi:hypothetical protein